MDLASIVETIAARGSMFWAATGSVALGGTLILVALVAQMRRLRRRTAALPAGIETRKTETPAGPAFEAETSPVRPLEEKFPPLPEPGSESADLAELRALATRLRSAADKLEEFRRNRGKLPAPAEESPLKETASGVDYVFRAGLG